MSEPSQTPRTDAAFNDINVLHDVGHLIAFHKSRDFARELEHELNEKERIAKAEFDRATRFEKEVLLTISECDQWRAVTEKLATLISVGVFVCPNCDGSGATIKGQREYVTSDMAMDACDPQLEGAIYREPEIEQCQWCDEKTKFLAEFDKLKGKA